MYSNRNINDDKELTEDQERMRRNLRYHFMNPKEKWQAKGTLPIKMILIVIKLIILTIQVILFSENNSNEVSFVEGSKTSFKHLFLKDWQSTFETLPYPPSSGPFAIYKIDEFYLAANYALENYYNLKKEAIGPYGFGDNDKANMTLCVSSYAIGNIFPSNSSYSFSNTVEKRCIELKPIVNNSTKKYDVKTFLSMKNFSINFNGFLKAELNFVLRSIQLKSYEMDQVPDCFQFDIVIRFDNGKHNGQVPIDLQTFMLELTCFGTNNSTSTGVVINNLLISIDSVALILSVLSFILCSRSIFRLYRFWKKARHFFLMEIGVDITNKRKYFVSISYMLIFFGDILVITGTIIKLHMNSLLSKKGIANFTLCNYFLGIGVFLGYLTLLRYFSYFPKSSILINTIKAAAPPLLRFSLCSVILYLAFSLLGWIILGPYHLKFRTLVSSIACLFSLMNGDDMYVTLSIINSNSPIIFVFSQLFIYTFCLLFIFVVLNLILTIIIEAYNEVQKQDLTVTQLDIFWNFINSCPESSKSPLYRSDLIYDKSLRTLTGANFSRKFVDTLCCCIGKGGHTAEIKEEHIDEENDDQMSIDFSRHLEHTNEREDELNQHLINRVNSPKVTYGSIQSPQKQSHPNQAESSHSQQLRDHACSF